MITEVRNALPELVLTYFHITYCRAQRWCSSSILASNYQADIVDVAVELACFPFVHIIVAFRPRSTTVVGTVSSAEGFQSRGWRGRTKGLHLARIRTVISLERLGFKSSHATRDGRWKFQLWKFHKFHDIYETFKGHFLKVSLKYWSGIICQK